MLWTEGQLQRLEVDWKSNEGDWVCGKGTHEAKNEFDGMHSGYMSGRGTNDTVFMVHYLQEKHLTANKPLYMALVDLEEVFQHVPRDVSSGGQCTS